jgi:hypothetical protein
MRLLAIACVLVLIAFAIAAGIADTWQRIAQ